MNIIELRDLYELEQCADLQQKVWGISIQDVIPTHLMKAYVDSEEPWGIILGAFAENKMVGCSLTFPTSYPEKYLLHMLGVLPDFHHKNIGYELIQRTKKLVNKKGGKKILLTFDPLESVNANLYFRKQKGICRKYVTDYYRTYNSKTHSGFPADRFKMEIFINQKDRENIISDYSVINSVEIHVPLNFQELKTQNIKNAIELRNRTRSLFVKYITEKNYIVTNFILSNQNTGKYVLEQH